VPHLSNSGILISVLLALDTLAVFLALAAATYLVAPELGPAYAERLGEFLPIALVFTVAWPLVAMGNRLYISRRRDDMLAVTYDITKSVLVTAVFGGFVTAYATPLGPQPLFLAWYCVSVVVFLSLLRIALQVVLWSLRRHGLNERNVLIIGVNPRTRQLLESMQSHPHFGYHPVGLLEDEPDRRRIVEEANLPYLGKFEALEQVLSKHVIDEVYICLPVRSRYETIQNMAQLCEAVGVSVRLIADLFPLRLATSRFHKMDGIPILALSTVPENQPQLFLQRLTDVIASGLLLIALAPVFLATALAIKLDSPGPVFFSQERVGLNRRTFRMIKFRSMVPNAEALRQQVDALNEVEGPMFKATNDPRITRVGRFIRKYSIDELPQLINVFKGEMSLVGPRPALVSEVAQYSWHQRRRLSVKPGMTGLSQVSGRSELSFRDTVDLDLYYIDQWSLLLVFRILLQTVPAVLAGRGAK
jgi:exopolysaccharide biosynthesis polyprenyl glycosylphosphotransferase